MKSILIKSVKYISVLLGGAIIGFLLMVLVFCLPEEVMQDNLKESLPTLTKYIGSSELISGYQATFDGSFTDGIMLQNAVYDEGHTLAEKAMGIYRNGWENNLWYPRETLVEYLNGVATQEYGYARYWHGYLVVLKPLLMLFNLEEIYFLNQILQFSLLMAVILGLSRKSKSKYAICYGMAYLFLVPIVMPMTLSLSICFYLYLIVNALQVHYHEYWLEKKWYSYVFLIVGMATSYFDFLTYPLVTLGMPLTIYFVLAKENNVKDNIKRIVGYSLSWGIGYMGMWSLKWLVGSLILGENVLRDAGETLAQRIDVITYESRILSFLNVVWYNMKMYKALPYWILTGVFVIVTVIMAIKHPAYKRKMESMKNVLVYFIILLMPFAWYAVALNHSGEHYMFTFRELVVTVFAGSCMLMSLFECKKPENKKTEVKENK